MQGKMIDMDKLAIQNEQTIAVGNVRMNARGDLLGEGGKIVKKREEVMAEYYETNPKALARINKPVETKAPPSVTEHIPGLDPVPEKPAKSSGKTQTTSSEE